MNTLERVSLANAEYVDEQYRRYLADPASVDERWALFFAGFDFAIDGNGSRPAAAAAEAGEALQARATDVRNGAAAAAAAVPPAVDVQPVLGVFDLVHSYRELGHLVAHLNPLARHARRTSAARAVGVRLRARRPRSRRRVQQLSRLRDRDACTS